MCEKKRENSVKVKFNSEKKKRKGNIMYAVIQSTSMPKVKERKNNNKKGNITKKLRFIPPPPPHLKKKHQKT